jgi:Ran GTPase-activating protein (RanGAP) involved in mRNA processing and transport
MVNAPNLRKLNISYNYISGSTFDLLAKVLEAAPLLRELDISGCILGTCPLILTQEIKL